MSRTEAIMRGSVVFDAAVLLEPDPRNASSDASTKRSFGGESTGTAVPRGVRQLVGYRRLLYGRDGQPDVRSEKFVTGLAVRGLQTMFRFVQRPF